MEAFETQAIFPGQYKNILEEMAKSLSDIKNLSDNEWQSPLPFFNSLFWHLQNPLHLQKKDHNIW